MKKIPISLIIDDPAPIVSVYKEHADSQCTKDGRPLIPTYSNELLFRFCDVVEKQGIKGKFSVVPMPGNKGDIVNGLEVGTREEMDEWLDTVKERIVPRFTIGPEMLTHHKAVDLATGKAMPMNEEEWAATQDRTGMTPYIALALSLLQEAGFDVCGVTSPWLFGVTVEEEYVAAISQAVYDVTGKTEAWYFLRSIRDKANAKPWVALDEGGRTVVAIPSTTKDCIWKTIDNPDTSDEFISMLADRLITADGREGEIIRVLETNGYPILVTHWQSLMSNGAGTGIRVLDEICTRINKFLGDRVEWMDFEQIMNLVLADKAAYPKPSFD